MSALHLCIDMQVWELEKFSAPRRQQFHAAVTETARQFQAYGTPTLYVAYTDPLEGERDPVGNLLGDFRQIQQALLKRDNRARLAIALPPDAVAATKTDYSAGQSRPIRDFVAMLAPRQIILTGAWEATHDDDYGCCVTQTAIDFRRAGYEVSIVAEATNVKYERPSDLVKRRLVHRPHGVRVDPLAAILQAL